MLSCLLRYNRLIKTIVGANDDAELVLRTVRERFIKVDSAKSGFVTTEQFRRVVGTLCGTRELMVSALIAFEGYGANHKVGVE